MKGGGSTQAIVALTVYHKLLALLGSMLGAGCCTGFVQIDLSNVNVLCRSVLAVSMQSCGLRGIDHSEASARAILRGVKGVSQVDTLLVAPSLKVHTLQLLRILLSLRVPTLMKASMAFCEPVASLLSSAEMSTHPAVSCAVLETIVMLFEAFPTVIARRQRSMVDTIIALFAADVENLTKEPSISTTAESATAGVGKGMKRNVPVEATLPFSSHSFTETKTKRSSSLVESVSALEPAGSSSDTLSGFRGVVAGTVMGSDALFRCVEALLRHCASMLSPSVQDRMISRGSMPLVHRQRHSTPNRA